MPFACLPRYASSLFSITKTLKIPFISLPNIAVTTLSISHSKPLPLCLPWLGNSTLPPQNQLTIMRHGSHYTPPPLLSPSPPPAINSTATGGNQHPMLVSVLLALFLPCAGMSAVFIVYICLLWYATNHRADNSVKQAGEKGLSVSELEKLPKVTGKDLVLGTECAVCLDEIEAEQSARMVPGCNHGFHLQCADTWLSKNSVCPVCRAKLEPKLFDPPGDDNPC